MQHRFHLSQYPPSPSTPSPDSTRASHPHNPCPVDAAAMPCPCPSLRIPLRMIPPRQKKNVEQYKK